MKKILTVLIVFCLLFLRLFSLPKLDLEDGQAVKVTGRLSEEPQVFGNQQRFKFGRFEIATERWPEYHYGDEIIVTGKLKVQDKDRKKQLFHYFIVSLLRDEKYLLSHPEIDFCKVGHCGSARPHFVKSAAIWLKNKFLTVYKKSFPSPFDGIVAGVVLGDKSLLPKNFWDKLKATGTLHLLVASGMNIALFAPGLLERLCTLFVRKISLLVLISLIWFYTLIAGMQPPIVRAAIMANLVYGSQFFGREKGEKRVLWATGILMLLASPMLIFDVGFQLSFLATAGIVYIQPKIIQNDKSRLAVGQAKFKILRVLRAAVKSDNFTSSLSAFLATAPILLLNFGSLNLLSPVVNLAVLWTIPLILKAGMGLGILGTCLPAGRMLGVLGIKTAGLLSFLLYPLLFYLEKIIEVSSKWTFLQIEGVKIGWWLVAGYYLILWLWVKNNFKFQISNSKNTL